MIIIFRKGLINFKYIIWFNNNSLIIDNFFKSGFFKCRLYNDFFIDLIKYLKNYFIWYYYKV